MKKVSLKKAQIETIQRIASEISYGFSYNAREYSDTPNVTITKSSILFWFRLESEGDYEKEDQFSGNVDIELNKFDIEDIIAEPTTFLTKKFELYFDKCTR